MDKVGLSLIRKPWYDDLNNEYAFHLVFFFLFDEIYPSLCKNIRIVKLQIMDAIGPSLCLNHSFDIPKFIHS